LGKEQEFPEVDRAEWFSLEEAKEKIQAGQIGFIKEFERTMSEEAKGA
jgi:predicted NUDIX family NTP pyrophosphohydrolase